MELPYSSLFISVYIRIFPTRLIRFEVQQQQQQMGCILFFMRYYDINNAKIKDLFKKRSGLNERSRNSSGIRRPGKVQVKREIPFISVRRLVRTTREPTATYMVFIGILPTRRAAIGAANQAPDDQPGNIR